MSDRKPVEIRLKKAERTLDVEFDDGKKFVLPAEFLRVESPSAEVQGHGNKQIVGGKKQVAITAIERVGHYAVRLTFDDGHDTGIYSWELLYQMGSQREHIWRRYLDALKERGMSRE